MLCEVKERKAAQITFVAALASYRNGVGSITDLNIASTQLLQAKNASIDADAYGALRLQRRPRWRWRSVRARHR
jgi:outer membrane protein TolC